MVIIGPMQSPEQGVLFQSDDIKLKIDHLQLDKGTLYVTESALCWKPDGRDDGISIPWKKICLHAISNNVESKSVFLLLDVNLIWPGIYEGKHKNQNGLENGQGDGQENNHENDEENDEGNESDASDVELTELWLEPIDQNIVEQIFNSMKHGQSLNPDSADSISEDDDNFMEAQDDEFEEVGQGDMRNLHIDDDEKYADAEE